MMRMNERVGTAQRQTVLEQLMRALEQGYIDLPEYERRMIVVQSAKFAGDLTQQTADLPRQFQWHPGQAVAHLTQQPPQQHPQLPPRDPRPMSIVSLVLGIISLPTAICYGVGAVPAVIALVLSRPGLKANPTNGMALAGLILAIIGFALSLLFFAVLVLMPDPVPPPA